MEFEEVRQIAVALPGVEEGTSYGTPALRVKGKLLARLREDGETLVLKVDPFERDHLLEARPEIYFLTDHYRGYPMVLMRLAAADPEELGNLLEQAWRALAPRRLLSSYDTARQ